MLLMLLAKWSCDALHYYSSAKKEGRQANESSQTEAAWETVVSDNPTRLASTNWVNHFGKTKWIGKWFNRFHLYHISIPFTCRHEQTVLFLFRFFWRYNSLHWKKKNFLVSTNLEDIGKESRADPLAGEVIEASETGESTDQCSVGRRPHSPRLEKTAWAGHDAGVEGLKR